ncbi:DUF3304 domain-containing protein [Pantoea vagans]|uniref:DUF3304 domain-containing protein n=1 Tax=Pantoea vagans TaxID=470934 RepID=UPI0010936B38|nr:DUF3304 domain-containing protein [Pantoea vagans]QCA06318.1 DUF3304 domain-containing protein [Pantoea vagans]
MRWLILAVTIVFISGCSHAGDGDYTAGDIRGFNHTQHGINHFSVNGYGGRLTGNSCCIMLPMKWTPGLKARIEWEVDPKTASKFPGYSDRIKFNKWKDELESSFQIHTMVVDIPQYGKERCGISVHFLPCNQVKVTTVCQGYGTPGYPIREPLNMKEPAHCPA